MPAVYNWSMAQKTRFVTQAKCRQCRDSFERQYKRQAFCSKGCQRENYKDKLERYREKQRRKLSRDKDSHKTGKIKRVCRRCQKVFYTYASQVRHRGGLYCSQECFREDKIFTNLKVATLDSLWSRCVKKMAGNRCEYCGTNQKLTSHHIFSRTNKKTRWDVFNGMCLCTSHHTQDNFSAHKSPIEFVEWLKEKRGEDWYDRLRIKAKTFTGKNNREEIANELLRIIKT